MYDCDGCPYSYEYEFEDGLTYSYCGFPYCKLEEDEHE